MELEKKTKPEKTSPETSEKRPAQYHLITGEKAQMNGGENPDERRRKSR